MKYYKLLWFWVNSLSQHDITIPTSVRNPPLKNSIVFYIGNFREFVHCFFKCKINEKYNDLGITEKPIVDFNTCPYNPMLIEFYEVSTVGLHKQALLIIGGKNISLLMLAKRKGVARRIHYT